MPNQLVFFSYSREDGAEFATKLVKDLKGLGANTWIDVENIHQGSNWIHEIENALTNSEFVLFLMTKKAIASMNVQNEALYALQEKKKLIPIRIDLKCKPPLYVRSLDYAEFSKDYSAALKKLALTLNLNKDTVHDTPVSVQKKVQSSGAKRYDSNVIINYNAYRDPLFWILILAVSALSVTCTYFASELFNYLLGKIGFGAYHLSQTTILITGISWGLAYMIFAGENAIRRKDLLMGFGIPFFNILRPGDFNAFKRGLFTALFLNVLISMIAAEVFAFLNNYAFNWKYSSSFLIGFIIINVYSLFVFITDDN